MDKEEREKLRRALRWCLRPQPWRKRDYDGRIAEWFENKLEGLVAYGLADKDKLSEDALLAVKLRFVDGWPEARVAEYFFCSIRKIRYGVNRVLDAIIDVMPNAIKARLVKGIFQWREKACPHCGGSQFFDPEDAEYCCLACGRREPA